MRRKETSIEGAWIVMALSSQVVSCFLSEFGEEEVAATAVKSLQSCLTVRPRRRQPTRLPHPWDSPGKNTGVGCHFLLQCRKVKSESEVAQSCLTLSDPMACSPPGSCIHGIFQARVPEWGAIAFSRRRWGDVKIQTRGGRASFTWRASTGLVSGSPVSEM